MQFEQKTLTILDEDRHSVEVTSWQGAGTGVAYCHPIYKDQPQGEEYILIHVPSGMAISWLTLPTEPEARAFLEAVAALDPDQWNFDLDEYKNRYYYAGRVMELQSKIEAAYNAAFIPRDSVFLYPVDGQGEAIIDDGTYDVDTEDPNDPSTKEIVDGIFSYTDAAVCVILTHMDARTGKHTDLHTYERSTSIEARI